jgi:cation:H+ antiporter
LPVCDARKTTTVPTFHETLALSPSIVVLFQLVFGFALLVGGGELLVRGAASLAAAFKISPLVIGLTVVAFGTSAPELGVSVQAAIAGDADVAIGNVVGSNITNVLLILGASALVAPLIVSSQLIRIDVPLMIGASFGLWGVAANGYLDRWEGVVMFTLLVLYIVYCIRKSRGEHVDVVHEFDLEYRREVNGALAIVQQLAFVIIGLVMLGFGAKLLVDGAVAFATWLGVSELVIGLTVVAVGTSLPEAVTSIVASYRGQRDIAVGNVVGSNLFNILCVLGLTAIVSPVAVPVSSVAQQFDIPVMVAVAVICLPIFWAGHQIRRFEGALLMVYYILYISYLIAVAVGYPPLAHPLLVGVLPLTVLALLLSLYHAWAARIAIHR